MCYVVPIAAAVSTTIAWNRSKSLKMWWLMLMFYGGGIFGFVDHLWNNELFLVSSDWLKDLSLGVVITAVIFLSWKLVLALAKRNVSLASYLAAGQQVK